MPPSTVRTHLMRAYGELEWVCESSALSDEEAQLVGIIRQLRYVTDGDQMMHTPEAVVTPDPDVLDTMYERLIDVKEQTDDDDAQVGLRRACDELGVAVVMLNDRLDRQHGVHEEARNTQ